MKDQKLEVLKAVYDDTMQRINKQQPGFRDLARNALCWLSHAKRQLKTLELQHALAVHMELDSGSVPQEFDAGNIPEIELIVSRCHGLVTVDEESDVIRLVHYTTQEYLDQIRQEWFPEAETTITNVCTSYLTMNQFSWAYTYGSDELNRSEIEEKLQMYPFFGYACVNWRHHARETDYSSQIIHDFLADEWQVRTAANAMRYIQMFKANEWRVQEVSINTALELTAYFGAVDLMKSLPSILDTSFEADTLGHALLSAVCNKQLDALRLLLEMGADTGVEGIMRWDALSLAAYWGEEDMVRLLLEWGAYPGATDSHGGSPLTIAVKQGHTVIVRLLLEKGASFDEPDGHGMTPIYHAVCGDNKAMIQVFFETVTDPKPKIYYMKKLMLKNAVCYSVVEAFKSVIEKGPKLKFEGKFGSELLCWALIVTNGCEEIAELLLEKGAKPMQQGEYGKEVILRKTDIDQKWLAEKIPSLFTE